MNTHNTDQNPKKKNEEEPPSYFEGNNSSFETIANQQDSVNTHATVVETVNNEALNQSHVTVIETANNQTHATVIETASNQALNQKTQLGHQTQLANTLDMPKSKTELPEIFAEKYKVTKILGAGAMGKVFEAIHIANQKKVAIKVIHKNQEGSASIVKRFQRESKLLQKLDHPSIIGIQAQGSFEGQLYFVMDLVQGQTFTDFLKKKLPLKQRLNILIQVLEAVHTAHTAGIVHRDLKPDNIMVNEKNRALVMDFGIARDQEDEGATKLTQTGMLIGTPLYMSPEQINGEKVTFKTDIYSIGVILYQILTGKRPFTGNVSKIMWQVSHVEAISPKEISPKIPKELSAICMKAIEKKPGERYPTARAMANDLKRYFTGKKISVKTSFDWNVWRKKNNKIIVGVASVALVLFGFFAMATGDNNAIELQKKEAEKIAAQEQLDNQQKADRVAAQKKELEKKQQQMIAQKKELERKQHQMAAQKKEIERKQQEIANIQKQKKEPEKKQQQTVNDVRERIIDNVRERIIDRRPKHRKRFLKEKNKGNFRPRKPKKSQNKKIKKPLRPNLQIFFANHLISCGECRKMLKNHHIGKKELGFPPNFNKVPSHLLQKIIQHEEDED